MCECDYNTYKLKCNEQIQRRTFNIFTQQLRNKKLPFFTPNEVVLHNSERDSWVSILGIVRNLTPLIEKYVESPLVKPILAFSGKDISHWFDPRTGDILHHIHPITGVRVPYTPHGLIPDVGPHVSTTAWEPINHPPWWFDSSLVVGYLTRNARPVRIMNVLTGRETSLEVCSEDTLEDILTRHLKVNSNAFNYTWKYEARVLNMNFTLDENGIPDPRPELRAANLPDDTFTPCLMLYFNDDSC